MRIKGNPSEYFIFLNRKGVTRATRDTGDTKDAGGRGDPRRHRANKGTQGTQVTEGTVSKIVIHSCNFFKKCLGQK